MDESKVPASIGLCDGSGGLVTEGRCGVGSEFRLLDGAAGRVTEKLWTEDFTGRKWAEVPLDLSPGDSPLDLASTGRTVT